MLDSNTGHVSRAAVKTRVIDAARRPRRTSRPARPRPTTRCGSLHHAVYKRRGRRCPGVVERLADVGCEDALAGIGQSGRLALAFTRTAVSVDAAVRSALEAVRRALPSAWLIEAAPDLVGLTDLANIVGVSRQRMRTLSLRHASGFPLPVHDGSTALWHLADVLVWLQRDNKRVLDPGVLDVAQIAWQVNVARAGQPFPGAAMASLAALLR